MLTIKAHEFIEIGKEMRSLAYLLGMISEDMPRTDEESDLIRDGLERLKGHCGILELKISAELLQKAIRTLPETKKELEIYLDAVKSELRTQLFFFVPSHRARYYETNFAMRDETLRAFPFASSETVRAATCYSLGEYTACVFHSMRAAELGLKAVVRGLPNWRKKLKKHIDFAEWKGLIDAIDKHIKALAQKPRTKKRETDQQFYGDVHSQFVNFKDAFRNHISHSRVTYSEEQAISIFHRSREFLDILSTRISE